MTKFTVAAALLLLASSTTMALPSPDECPTAADSGRREFHLGDEITQEQFREQLEETPFKLREGLERYATATYSALAEETDGNVVASPFSLHTALSMLFLGSPAGSETHREMAGLLGLQQDTNEYAINYLQLLSRYDELRSELDTRVEFANRMFLARGFSLKPDYRLLMRTYYVTDLTTVDFGSSGAASDINRWVSCKTHGLVSKLLEDGSVDALTRMVIVNAIYFKAQWKYMFDPADTRSAPFRVSSHSVYDHEETMSQRGEFYHANVPEVNARVLELPYEDEDFRMLVFLPHDPDGIRDLDRDIAGLDFPRMERRMGPGVFRVQIPKFKADASFDMVDNLRSMGVNTVFDPNLADLSDIAEVGGSGPGGLYVSGVVHKAVVEVSEEGTEAAAATAVNVGIRTVRPGRNDDFIADRPFVFVIQDRRYGVPLFIGRVVDPENRGRALGDPVEAAASEVFEGRQSEPQNQQKQEEEFSDSDEEEVPDCPEGYQRAEEGDISFPCRGRETMVLEEAAARAREALQRRMDRVMQKHAASRRRNF